MDVDENTETSEGLKISCKQTFKLYKGGWKVH
jgi:hypothetical protein